LPTINFEDVIEVLGNKIVENISAINIAGTTTVNNDLHLSGNFI